MLYGFLLFPSQDSLLSVLTQHLDESALQTRSFLVNVSETSIAKLNYTPRVSFYPFVTFLCFCVFSAILHSH